jgi:hypothetical protein
VRPTAHRRFLPLAIRVAWLLLAWAWLCALPASACVEATVTPPAKTASWDLDVSESGRISVQPPLNQDCITVAGACGYKTASVLSERSSRDPIAENGGLNIYGYVRQNSWSSFDPLGLESDDDRKHDADTFGRLARDFAKEADKQWTEARESGVSARAAEAHQAASESAKKIAGDMQHRAEILAHANENNYREQVRRAYDVNNPDFNSISAFYADKFNDKDTLNFLAMQHPATPGGHAAFLTMAILLAPETAFASSVGEGGLAGAGLDLEDTLPRYNYSKSFNGDLAEYHTGPDGKPYDPSGIEIKPGDYWEIGHAGDPYAIRIQKAAERGMSKEAWFDQEHDLRLFRPERRYTNRSNLFQDWKSPNEPSIFGL